MASATVLLMNLVSDPELGLNFAPIASRSLSLADIPRGPAASSLLVGLYEDDKLIFVAKVKNGFVPLVRDETFPKLQEIATPKCPFNNLPEKKGSRRGESLTVEKMKECRWVKPDLVCQVRFLEWTEAGHLRHCSFIALRDDKDASKVVRET